MGMEVHQVPVGLDGKDDARDSGRVRARCPKESFQGVRGALTEFPEGPATLPEVHPEHLPHREDVLSMQDGGQDFVGRPGTELEDALLLAGESPPAW